MSTQEQLFRVYAKASAGDEGAYAWLLAFHGWVHEIDDFIDEEGHASQEVVALCAKGVVICSAPFFQRHAEALGPVLCTIAAQYQTSLKTEGKLKDVLRVAGNQAVLVVAYLRGGFSLQEEVSAELWPIVEKTQLE